MSLKKFLEVIRLRDIGLQLLIFDYFTFLGIDLFHSSGTFFDCIVLL